MMVPVVDDVLIVSPFRGLEYRDLPLTCLDPVLGVTLEAEGVHDEAGGI